MEKKQFEEEKRQAEKRGGESKKLRRKGQI